MRALAKTWFVVENDANTDIIADIKNKKTIRIISKDYLHNNPLFNFKKNDKIIISSEVLLHDVLRRLDDDYKKKIIVTLKNKVMFRRMLSAFFPNFFFKEISIQDLATLDLDPHKRYFVKPVKGYWGSAAYTLNKDTDRNILIKNIKHQLQLRAHYFPHDVIAHRLILEEFIEGDEYAVDMFYNKEKQPIITNIYYHPMPKKSAYLNIIYYTNYDIFTLLYQKLLEFFVLFNKILQAYDMPIHGEFRLYKGVLTPIELNPLRFGSDGLADLSYHAFGFNPYLYFANDTAPPWDIIWQQRKGKNYIYFIGYNGSDINICNYRPDYQKFRELFSNIRAENIINYQNSPAFSIVHAEESNLDRVHELLDVEFNDYFIDIKKCSNRSYQKLCQIGVKMTLAAGYKLWDINDFGDYLILVMIGEVEVYLPSNNGEILLETYGPGAVIGEMSVLNGLPRSAAVRCKTFVKVVKITGIAFRRLLAKAPDIWEDLYWQQSNRVLVLNKRLMSQKK